MVETSMKEGIRMTGGTELQGRTREMKELETITRIEDNLYPINESSTIKDKPQKKYIRS